MSAMSQNIKSEYDVIIMGGGPAGSTLAALLAKRTDLRIAVFDKEVFPREHIGESFAHPLMPVLEETGALEKVLASDCWVKKFGGIFNWGGPAPNAAFFDHLHMAKDGVHRWAMHVNRAEFDHILLDHAADLGAEVFQGVSVSALDSHKDGCQVTLKDGRTVRAGYFVDASGRRNSIAAKQKREWLSGYRNIAIWQHFLGGKPAHGLPGEWNIFREDGLSPIGCFAFKNGWCWYIPVPKIIDGERRLTHSIGIVTDPAILKEPGSDFTDPETFLRTVQSVPVLETLIQDVRPVGDRMLTATNYSMINETFADYDERWILIGDASYFVDPLFSSGVAFAANQAAAAALLLESSLFPGMSEQDRRDLWRDYDEGWHGMAKTFALSIDQWYAAIGRNNPGSVYWKSRSTDGDVDLDIQDRTFDVLLNTAVTPNLLEVITGNPGMLDKLGGGGAFTDAARMAEPDAVDPDLPLVPAPNVAVRRTVGLEVPGFKAVVPPPPFEASEEVRSGIPRYWEDPVRNGDAVRSPVAEPVPCHRFSFEDRPDGPEIRGLDRDGTAELWHLLSTKGEPVTMRQLEDRLTLPQQQLLKRLLRFGMVTVGTPVPEGAGAG